MPMVDADWTIDRQTGNIRYIGDDHGGVSPSYATVIEFHRWLQDFADDAVSSGDDELDITDSTPSDRSTDNIITLLGSYNIDANASEHLYDGSIIQSSGAVIYDGIVNFGNATTIQIHQDGAVLADDWWNNDPQGNGFGLNSDPASGISHRFMINVRTAGSDIDLRRLLGTTRRFNFTYGEFAINATARGNNVLALSEASDLNNQTAVGTVGAYDQFTNTEGYALLDVNNDTTNEPYYSNWDWGAGTTPASPDIGDFYEWIKYLQRDGSVSTTYAINGELFRGPTHEFDVDGQGVTDFSAVEAVSWTAGTGGTAGTGQLLAVDDVNAASKMWVQLLTGGVPGDNAVITGGTSGATANLNITVTARTVSTPAAGQSTGSALIGAYGLGINPARLGSSDLLRALDNVTYQPPNNVTFTVSGLVIGEDYVLVTEDAGSTINTDQFGLASALNTDNITTVTIGGTGDNATIPSDTPAAGTIRVVDDAGRARKLNYTAYTTTQFTGITGAVVGEEDFLASPAAINNDVYITYLDKLAAATSEQFTVVFLANRTLFIRVRDGGTAGDGIGIKTFETTATLGSGGGNTTVIRTADA